MGTCAPRSAYPDQQAVDETKSQSSKARDAEVPMDASWNWFIDNIALRTALNVTTFAVWLGLTIGLLAIH